MSGYMFKIFNKDLSNKFFLNFTKNIEAITWHLIKTWKEKTKTFINESVHCEHTYFSSKMFLHASSSKEELKYNKKNFVPLKYISFSFFPFLMW